MGIFSLFTGKTKYERMYDKNPSEKNVSEAVLSSIDAKNKYEAAFKNFEKCYNDYWSRSKRGNNITMLIAGIETFSHKADYEKIYSEKYKPVVSVVLNFPNLLKIQDALLLMDAGLRNPSNTTLKRFDKNKEKIHSMIENEEKIGRMVASFLISDDIFKKSLDTRLSKETAAIFALYVALSIAEKEYYLSMCSARDKTVPSN
ncbi:MAG: hypothetical protein ACP5NW_00400 [Candidatus Woesearchaeota archaeon]